MLAVASLRHDCHTHSPQRHRHQYHKYSVHNIVAQFLVLVIHSVYSLFHRIVLFSFGFSVLTRIYCIRINVLRIILPSPVRLFPFSICISHFTDVCHSSTTATPAAVTSSPPHFHLSTAVPMNQKTWPPSSTALHFTALPFIKNPAAAADSSPFPKPVKLPFFLFNSSPKIDPSEAQPGPDFAALPYDVLSRIAAAFTLPNLKAASLVCKSWRDALKPLREAMVFLKLGKRLKHGRGGVKPSLSKALGYFLQGAARGSTLAMVDAGLIYWEMGKKGEGIVWYIKAAELGDPAGQCNLAISYLQASPPKAIEAIEWLYKASYSGYIRAQYQLALCLHQGRGAAQSLQEAARWYLRAAEGGYVRAMYNTSLCYLMGEGLVQSHKLARKWMKRAADHGHSKAQFEHGLSLFSEGQMMKAVVYLELANRAGERAAAHVKNVILQQLSSTSRDRAMVLADSWHVLPSYR